jgi:zinc protease
MTASTRPLIVLLALALGASAVSAQASGPAPAALRVPPADSLPLPTIPVDRVVLRNGLAVLLSRDTTAPVVTVTVWYHVGSKNEVPGRTGFAHLFEHVMFQGSAHAAKGEHIKVIEDAGGNMNGSTTNDRTNYFETVPANYLSTVLWLESDRMGSLLSALTQEKLDNQRDVVKNERRYRVDNQPYGRAGEVIDAALFPPDNPYSWPVIGSMADLSAASLDDVKQFFRTYYAPNNAVLSISGDIDLPQARMLVERYFGSIPRGPDIHRPAATPATLAGEKRLVLEDAKATLPRLVIVWPTVGVHSADLAPLDALAALLTQDRTSRLTKLLVYDLQLATSVTASDQNMEDAGTFRITINPRPGASLTRLEQLVDSVVGGLASTPPSSAEAERTKSYAVVGTITGLEPTTAKAETLAEGQTYFGDPLHYRTELREAEAITPVEVARVARQYLTAGRVVLSMVPAGKLDLVSKPDEPYTNATSAPEGAVKGAP